MGRRVRAGPLLLLALRLVLALALPLPTLLRLVMLDLVLRLVGLGGHRQRI